MPLDLLVVFIAISVLILIHEVGHFFAARFFHIWVEEFGIGLPPKIFAKKIGETKYSVNILPMGGFVRLHGEEQPHDLKHFKNPKRAFFKKPWWQRSIVLVAGSLMNFLFAVVVISYLFTRGVPLPDKVAIKEVVPNSPAAMAGFVKDDLLVKIDNQPISEVTEVTKLISERLDKETVFQLERTKDNTKETIIVSATPRKNPPKGEGALGIVMQQQVALKKYPIFLAPIEGLKTAFRLSLVLVKAITGIFWDFLSGFKVPKDVAGPIGMYQLYGEARKDGLTAILELTGLISLNLAVINLFPLPPMDGARFLLVLVERISGKRLRKEWEEKMYQISFIFLITLFVLISIQDIRRLLGF